MNKEKTTEYFYCSNYYQASKSNLPPPATVVIPMHPSYPQSLHATSNRPKTHSSHSLTIHLLYRVNFKLEIYLPGWMGEWVGGWVGGAGLTLIKRLISVLN